MDALREIAELPEVEDVRMDAGDLLVSIRRGVAYEPTRRRIRQVALRLPGWTRLRVVLAQPAGVRRLAVPTAPGLWRGDDDEQP